MKWAGVVALIAGLLWGSSLSAQTTTYTLDPTTQLIETCDPGCVCDDTTFADTVGEFTLVFQNFDGPFAEFLIESFDAVMIGNTGTVTISGSGTYRIDLSPDPHVHEVVLDLLVNGEPVQFESGLVQGNGFPSINIVASSSEPCLTRMLAIETEPDPAQDFVRGDADANGIFNAVVDGTFLFTFQFIPGSTPPPCFDAADADNSGTLNGLVDGLYILHAGFVAGSPPPPPPFPNCGPDDDSALGCDAAPIACP